MPHITNFTLADVSWLLDYFDSENQLIVVTNDSLINNSTYLVGELPKNLEVRLGLKNDYGKSHSKMCYCKGCLHNLYREEFVKEIWMNFVVSKWLIKPCTRTLFLLSFLCLSVQLQSAYWLCLSEVLSVITSPSLPSVWVLSSSYGMLC